MAKYKRNPSIIQLFRKKSYISKIEYDIYPLEAHEPIGNSNRKNSMEDGLWIWVTRNEHRWLHDTELGEQKNADLKELMQLSWMKKNYPDDYEKGINEFRKRYFKSYL